MVVAIDTRVPGRADDPGQNGPGQADSLQTAEVEWVIDGDTIDLIIGDQTERVRLIGIDTPESVSRNVPEQCYGVEAAEALKALLPVGTQVEIRRDAEARDRYGRLLLYVHRAEDHLFVNRWLIEHGFADAVSYRPNTTHERDFAAALRTAKSERVGLWSVCDGPDQPLS